MRSTTRPFWQWNLILAHLQHANVISYMYCIALSKLKHFTSCVPAWTNRPLHLQRRFHRNRWWTGRCCCRHSYVGVALLWIYCMSRHLAITALGKQRLCFPLKCMNKPTHFVNTYFFNGKAGQYFNNLANLENKLCSEKVLWIWGNITNSRTVSKSIFI